MSQYKNDFPLLVQPENDKPLIYFDNAATTQKPSVVIQAMEDYYKSANANPYRGLYHLSEKATRLYEDARETVKEFIQADSMAEVIFTRNTSESLNLVAYSYGLTFIEPGDEIAVLVSEHHSNLLPWQMVAKAKGAKLVYLYPNDELVFEQAEIDNKITDKTKIVAFAHVSNVTGIVNPIKALITRARKVGAITVMDTAQGIPHIPVNVKELDVDFLAFSGHKLLGPMGIGVLYGKKELLEKMPPFLTGGEMIDYVYEQEAVFAPLPQKFEAGTPNVGGAVGLAAAIRYLQLVGYETIWNIEKELMDYFLEEIKKVPHVNVYGNDSKKAEQCGVVSFTLDDIHPHDVSSILDEAGIAIRAGNHCAQPFFQYLKINSGCRASLYFYNTKEEIDIFIDQLKKVRGWLGYGD